MNLKNSLGKEKFVENLYNVKYFSSKKQLFAKIEKFKPDIIFNDILNTKIDYMKKLRENGAWMVNFEDVGDGRRFSDLVINPIFSTKMKFQNEYLYYFLYHQPHYLIILKYYQYLFSY